MPSQRIFSRSSNRRFAPESGRSPTGATSENPVAIAKNSMPWESGSGEGKYQYHPGGDSNAPPKDAPSAINVVVVPNVNLPKVQSPELLNGRQEDHILIPRQSLHDKWNKWGKDGY